MLKVKVSSLVWALIYISIAINIYVQYFFGIEINAPFNITLLLGFLEHILLLFCYPREYTALLKKYRVPLVAFLILMIMETIYSMLAYSQSLFDVYVAASSWAYLTLAIPILVIFQIKGRRQIFEEIAKIVTIVVALRLLQYILYNTNHIVIFPSLVNHSMIMQLRNDRTRMSLPCLGIVILLYNFNNFQSDDKSKISRLWYLLGFIVILFSSCYMSQGRMELIVEVISVFAMILYKKKSSMSQFIILTLSILGVFALLQFGLFDKVLSSFSVTSNYGGSTQARLITISYYKTSPYRSTLFGMGLINTSDYFRYLIVHRTLGSNQAYYSDIGLLGLYYNIGIIGILIYLYYFMVFAKGFVCAVRRNVSNERIFVIGLFCYYIFSSISILPFSAAMIFVIPFLHAYIVDYMDNP